MASLLATALARAQGFLLEPAPPVEAPAAAIAAPAPPVRGGTLQVAVLGLGPGAGTSTIALGLASALARPGLRPAHLVALASDASEGTLAGGVRLWTVPAALADRDEVAAYGATLARLVGGPGVSAAVVWDVPAGDTERAGGLVEGCDVAVAVADSRGEPALCALVCEMLAERCGRVLLSANRVRDPEAWEQWAACAVPDSRLAALLVARGRVPGGDFGLAVRRLAALVEEA